MTADTRNSAWLSLEDRRTRILLRSVLLGLPILWLAVSAAWIRVEYYDGFDAICNARFFTGEFPAFVITRAPLMGALLAPIRVATRALQLHPLAVGPYHAFLVVLHSLFLLGVYQFLRLTYRETLAVGLAFAGSVLNFVFFSYAPFISHDILPGGMLLGMLILAEKLSQKRCFRTWCCLVLLGASAALLKQTYGLFWVLILASRALPAVFPRSGLKRTSSRVWVGLVCSAAVSGAIYWIAMGWVLRVNLPEVSFMLRPLRQMIMVGTQYRGSAVHFPVWVFLRNFPFYGMLTTVLVVPGIWRALRSGDRFDQSLALSWIGAFMVMHLVSMREVRYLAFLMPLSAYLVAGALTHIRVLRRYRIVWVCLAAVDLFLGFGEAARLRDPFYREAPQRRFCDAGLLPSDRAQPLFYTDMLSFVPSRYSPFAGDRFHRLFHIGVRHWQILYGVPLPKLHHVTDPDRELAVAAGKYPGACLFTCRSQLYNPPRMVPGPPAGLEEFAMAATVSQRACRSDTGTASAWHCQVEGEKIFLVGEGIGASLEPFAFPCLVESGTGAAYALRPIGANRAEIAYDGAFPGEIGEEGWEVWGFRIRALGVPAPDRRGLEYIFFDFHG